MTFNPKNPFPKSSKCEYPGCKKNQEAIMRGIKFCNYHFRKVDNNRVNTKKDITPKEIRKLMKELRANEIYPLKRLL